MTTIATLCSGIAAPEVGAARVGDIRSLWCAEVEAFPSAVLAARFPESPNLGDITAADFVERARGIGVPDVLVAGTPCQAFSVAGRRGGLADARGNLTLRFVDICNELDPSIIVWENVPGVLSDADNAFGCLLGGLAGADGPVERPGGGSWARVGVVAGPRRRLVWRVLDAQHFGVAQRRRRVFVVACPLGGADPVSILFERGSGGGHPAAGGSKRACVAGTFTARAQGGGGLGTDFECDGGLIAHTLRGEGFDASEDGTGRGTPLVVSAVTAKWAKGSGGPAGDECQNLIAFNARQDPDVSGEITQPLDTDGHSIGVLTRWAVRRLMPVECERLQGFDDGWTDVEHRGQPASDAARYRAIGNSMAVPCLEWILAGVGEGATER
jgi:DNA (cytosine-5)-methyltransferase 1